MFNTKLKKAVVSIAVLLVVTTFYSWYLLSSGSWYEDPEADHSGDSLRFNTNLCLQFKRTGLLLLKLEPYSSQTVPGIVLLNSVNIKESGGEQGANVRFFVNPFNSTLSVKLVDPETKNKRSNQFKWQQRKCQ